ncbi:hypothetical protein KQX54_007225 [Cotesia glomerata]|uniref:Uncharacterized protein n=1 Tax=Cotesia glomerata TaxID=32391 RepID=A0AAV7I204_COTGL|nr:hypothetical protein KQX54_007225 [Cotesia glomerata]
MKGEVKSERNGGARKSRLAREIDAEERPGRGTEPGTGAKRMKPENEPRGKRRILKRDKHPAEVSPRVQRGREGAALDLENPAQRAEPCGGRYETPLNETSSAPCDSAGVWLSHPRNCSSLNLSIAVAARLMSLAAHR